MRSSFQSLNLMKLMKRLKNLGKRHLLIREMLQQDHFAKKIHGSQPLDRLKLYFMGLVQLMALNLNRKVPLTPDLKVGDYQLVIATK